MSISLRETRAFIRLRWPVAPSLLALALCLLAGSGAAQSSGAHPKDKSAAEATPLPEGSWRFIVSGDSRNCGDIIMPTIAAHSARFSPNFYWHLGDLRAIYKIDEDMAFAASNNGQELTCGDYQKRAWNDFIDHQITPFGHLPFYVGIGNHEVIAPKTEDEFKRQFADWLDQPTLHQQRLKDKEPPQPETYYHWIQGGVDFIYLDNASNSFSDDEFTWLKHRLASAKTDASVKSVVVGMHEALPDSLSKSHSMGDTEKDPNTPGAKTGKAVYDALTDFRDHSKPVYVLASHSHFYMDNIFETPALTPNHGRPLPGWIIGTAGAVRLALPDQARPTAMTDVYGYLLGTVATDGTIQFSFQGVHESDIPQPVRERYTNAMIPWCFAHNSQNRVPVPKDITPSCNAPGANSH